MSNLGQSFNEGLSSGGFAATVGGNIYVFDPFNVSPEVMVVKTKDATGVATKKQGFVVDKTASSTVQVPYDGSENPIWLVEGDTFTDPDGNQWWVSEAPTERRSGDVRKQNIKCELRLN
jgi:hypothetical protein